MIFHKIKKKVPLKKVRTGNEAETKADIKTPDIPDFLDCSYWTRWAEIFLQYFLLLIFNIPRKTVCCGVIYVGLLGEVMVDQRFYKKCSNHQKPKPADDCQSIDLLRNSEVGSSDKKMVDDATFSEYSDSESFTSREDDLHYTDTDEGFQVCWAPRAPSQNLKATNLLNWDSSFNCDFFAILLYNSNSYTFVICIIL